MKDQDKNKKLEQLNEHKHENTGKEKKMTTDSGMKVSNNNWSLRAGKRGPTLLQDIHFYRKQSRFSRERIPEKVVHARGFGVHGVFKCTKSMKEHTMAQFLQESGRETPVFVRFSSFIGSKGSKDTAVDVRGFATKFYTQEGNYDSLALSFPVFVLADAMKFVDFVHAIKPNPKTETPQAAAAHDRVWDYISNHQESAHFIMWLMSDRGKPRSWRMMEGYPVNTFRFINEEGKATFVRFKWIPKLGVHSLLQEEADIIGGVDPDFHRHDIIEAIQKGVYPEYELGVQMIQEEDEFKQDFDVLDDTKLWPEESFPFEVVGKMTLNKLVDNFFAEEEQSSFDPSTIVPGIDFSNDPVLQGRTFAYRDTDYHRLGTENINEIPINRPIVDTNYNNRDGYSKYRIDTDEISYNENSLADNAPQVVSPEEGGFEHYPQEVEGEVTREIPSDSFTDYFSQARMFWNSMSDVEKKHLIETFSYHLIKIDNKDIRQKIVDMFSNVDKNMSSEIAENIGARLPEISHVDVDKTSPVLSMANTVYSHSTQKVGVIIGNDFNEKEVISLLKEFEKEKVFYKLISEKLGKVSGDKGSELEVEKTFSTVHPALFDSVYVVGSKADNQEKFDKETLDFIHLAYKYYKPIGVSEGAEDYIKETGNLEGVIFAKDASDFKKDFIEAIGKQRFWTRTI